MKQLAVIQQSIVVILPPPGLGLKPLCSMQKVKEEVKRLVKMLRENGVSEEEIRELFEADKKPLVPLTVTKSMKILYGNEEIDLRPIAKAVYLLFLRHPEGIRFKELPDYRYELRKIYLSMKLSTAAKKKVEKSVLDVTDPLNHSIIEKCARIKAAFLKVMDAETAKAYIISGIKGEARKIELDRSLVVWEEKEGPPK